MNSLHAVSMQDDAHQSDWCTSLGADLVRHGICPNVDQADEAVRNLSDAVLQYDHMRGLRLPAARSLLSLAELSQADNERVGRLTDPSAPLVLGWLKPAPASDARRLWCPGDVGILVLADGGNTMLPCSACANAMPRPELLGALVGVSTWHFVPATSTSPPYIELDGPLLQILPPPSPPRPPARSWNVDEAAVRALHLMETGGAKLIHLRGELVALSEPYGTHQPFFFAELASPSRPR